MRGDYKLEVLKKSFRNQLFYYIPLSLGLAMSIAFNLAPIKLFIILIIIGMFIVSKVEIKLYYLMLWMPFITLLTISGVAFSAYNLIVIIFLFHKLLQKNNYQVVSLILTVGVILVSLLNITNMPVFTFLAWVSSILLLFFVFGDGDLDKDKILHILFGFTFGVFWSSLIGLMVRIFFPNADFFFKTTSAISGQFSLLILRFTGLMHDPNYYAQSCLMAIACGIILLKSDYFKGFSKNLIRVMIFFTILFGFYSYSKMFIFSIALVMIMIFGGFIIDNNKNPMKIIVSISIVAILAIIVLNTKIVSGYTYSILQRLSGGDLTTGRLGIAAKFWEIFKTDYRAIILGNGVDTARDFFGFELHNIYLETIFTFGIIGTTMYTAFLLHHFKLSYIFNGSLNKYYYMLPLVILFLTGFSLHGIWADWHYLYLIVAFYSIQISSFNIIEKRTIT